MVVRFSNLGVIVARSYLRMVTHKIRAFSVAIHRDNYALDGAQYQPVTHAGFVCPGNAYDPVACPAWKVMIDTVRQLSPDTAIFPVRRLL